MSDSLSPAPSASNPQTLPAQAPAFLAALQKLAASGFRSSEFWLVVSVIALLVFASVESKLPPELASILGTALVLGYKYFRTQVKATNGYQIVNLAAQFGDAAVISGRVGVPPAAPGVPPGASESPTPPLRAANLFPIAALLLAFAGCTIIPTQHGKAQFWGDYTNLKFDDGSVHLSASRATHSPAVRAEWQGASNLAAQAVAGAIGLKGGNEVVGGIATVIPPIVNRPTNRPATP